MPMTLANVHDNPEGIKTTTDVEYQTDVVVTLSALNPDVNVLTGSLCSIERNVSYFG